MYPKESEVTTKKQVQVSAVITLNVSDNNQIIWIVVALSNLPMRYSIKADERGNLVVWRAA